MERDTIVAVVTPPGEGGVGVVRASGPLAPGLLPRLLPNTKGTWRSHRLRHGVIIDPGIGKSVDDVLACVMRAPGSYTGEDVVEFHCHGNPLILERVVHLCLREGCRPACPGEFTLRAFLNERLDLSQSEAVLDVVRARSNAALDVAMRQMAGQLSARIEPIRDVLMGVAAHMEAMVDFVEDDIPAQPGADTVRKIKESLRSIEALIAGTEQGIVLRQGASLAIVGSPNVGKSSIMNGLLGMERSIVTPIAGTTRDTIEETLTVRGVPFRTVDTAGITETVDVVESIGVERSRQALQGADVVVLVLDRSRALNDQDEMTVGALKGSTARLVVAANKADLPAAFEAERFTHRLAPCALVESSTVQPGGLDALRDALEMAVLGSHRQETVSGNVRHRDALRRAAAALTMALQAFEGGVPLDLISFDVRAAAAALGEITGHDVDDELLDRIFRDFCIGK